MERYYAKGTARRRQHLDEMAVAAMQKVGAVFTSHLVTSA